MKYYSVNPLTDNFTLISSYWPDLELKIWSPHGQGCALKSMTMVNLSDFTIHQQHDHGAEGVSLYAIDSLFDVKFGLADHAMGLENPMAKKLQS